MIDRRPAAPNGGQPLPDFQPVERRYRHDGWTPERQRGFIAALADTGSVKRAAAMVNMASEGAYYLRRQAGAESFRRAWEAALDFGVQRLKDIAVERAIEGELVPVMSFGKLVGYRRVTNDRLLMFCLRMNARAPDGRRYAHHYFDPAGPRLSGSPVPSPLGDEAVDSAPQGQGLSGGQADRFMAVRSTDGGVAPNLHPLTLTAPVPTPAEQADDQAALIRGFDPVALSLDQIEQLQAVLSAAAATRRAELADPARDPAAATLTPDEGNRLLEWGVEEVETGVYHQPAGEIAWDMLDPEGLAEQARIDDAVAQVKAARNAKAKPALSVVEGPVLSGDEGPALSDDEGTTDRLAPLSVEGTTSDACGEEGKAAHDDNGPPVLTPPAAPSPARAALEQAIAQAKAAQAPEAIPLTESDRHAALLAIAREVGMPLPEGIEEHLPEP